MVIVPVFQLGNIKVFRFRKSMYLRAPYTGNQFAKQYGRYKLHDFTNYLDTNGFHPVIILPTKLDRKRTNISN